MNIVSRTPIHRDRPADILLVEDNPGDVRLTREALKDAQVASQLHWVKDGAQALAFLHREGEFAEAPAPDLILLDLNLPKINGRQVLSIIKREDKLARIPVVVLSSSRAEDDVLGSYDLHANCFITKPTGLEEYVDVINAIDTFWLSVVTLPEDAT